VLFYGLVSRELPLPCDLKIFYVVSINLIQGRVFGAGLVPSLIGPFGISSGHGTSSGGVAQETSAGITSGKKILLVGGC
jgi:hypothetical protein